MNSNKNCYRILQANIQSLGENKGELIKELKNNEYFAAVLSETWTKENLMRQYNINGFCKIIQSRDDGYGGVAIFLKNTLNFKQVVLTSSWNFEVVGIFIEKLNMLLVSTYVNPNISIREFESALKKLLSETERYDFTIIGGDFNCHHTAWGCLENKNKGEVLYTQINMS